MDRKQLLQNIIEDFYDPAADNTGLTDEELYNHLCYCFSDALEKNWREYNGIQD